MNTTDPAARKVKYIASIIYLLVFSFVVGGTYINQQMEATATENTDIEVN